MEKDVVAEYTVCNVHGEWSTTAVTAALHFIGALGWTNSQSNTAGAAPSRGTILNIPNNKEVVKLKAELKLDVSNINIFVCNNRKGKFII